MSSNPPEGTEKRYLILSAKELALSIIPEHRDVLVHLNLAEMSAGLVPGFEFALRLSPSESRDFAQALSRKADEAEAR